MWTDKARQAAAEARAKVNDWKTQGTSDKQAVSGIRALFGLPDRGNAQAATALAQGNPKSGGPRYAVQAMNTKLAGTPWQTVRRVGNSTVAERIAMRMASDSTHRDAPASRQTFRVK
jgi:hypothetical protein